MFLLVCQGLPIRVPMPTASPEGQVQNRTLPLSDPQTNLWLPRAQDSLKADSGFLPRIKLPRELGLAFSLRMGIPEGGNSFSSPLPTSRLELSDMGYIDP